MLNRCQTSWRCLIATAALLLTTAVPASEQSPPPRTILILGDSLTAGAGLPAEQGYPALLQRKLATANVPDQILNAGQSGDTTAGGLRRLDWLLQQRVDVLIVALGGNDGLRGIAPDVTRANLQAIIDRARARQPAIQIVLAGMKMPPNLGPDFVARFNAIFPELARANEVAFVPFLLEGVGGRPEFNQPDMIHPNAAGQRRIAATVWAVLWPLLEPPAAASAKTK